MVMNSELSGDVQKLVDYFDTEVERFLDFDIQYNGKNLKDYLDNLTKNENGWNKIAAACRWMIICDRELDLEKGTELMKNTIDAFNELNHGDQPYEAIRYFNTCGLISYRCGDYSSAKTHFEQAKEMTEKIPSMNPFVPDLTSNVIRTEFEFFSHTLPPKEIEIGDVDYYVKRFKEDFIEKFKDALKKSSRYYTDDEKLNLIYSHGMASLYHNLGDCYHILFKKLESVDESKANNALNKSERCHRQSLDWGEKVDDKYRQLQSKRYLSVLNTVDESERKRYEEEVLKGKWVRGKQMIYQSRIVKSKDREEINGIIKELRLDKNEKDKIVLLYNYNAIKTAITKNHVQDIVDKNGKELTLLNIAKAKIDVAEKMRNEFYLLYRRQAINLIRDDVLEIIEDCWEKGNYEEVINWSERYSCRDLIELSQISLDKLLDLTNEQKKKIAELKKPIFEEGIREINKYSGNNVNIPLSLTLGVKTHDKFLKLKLAYESVLERPSKDFERPKQDVCTKLIGLLKKIPPEENTAVLKFLIFEKGKKRISRALLIKRDKDKPIKREFDFDNLYISTDTVKPLKRKDDDYIYYMNMFRTSMTDLLKKLKLDEELKGVKNLFIIPDGELFQLPIHSIFEDVQDLNVYYSPTVTHFLAPPDYNNSNKAANYLWVLCPTDDLCKDGKPIVNHPKYKHIKTLQCEDAALKSFDENYEPNKFTHVGFSTHGIFHDHSKDAYVSQIMFNNSFLTPYDILFRCDFSGVQTIFLGCCEVGKIKYTDENEAIGLVTAFLSKKAVSVIAPLWTIDEATLNNFITAVDKSHIVDSPKAWNLADIVGKFKNFYETIPFVQYASIAIVVRRLPREVKQEILSYLHDNHLTYNQNENVE